MVAVQVNFTIDFGREVTGFEERDLVVEGGELVELIVLLDNSNQYNPPLGAMGMSLTAALTHVANRTDDGKDYFVQQLYGSVSVILDNLRVYVPINQVMDRVRSTPRVSQVP